MAKRTNRGKAPAPAAAQATPIAHFSAGRYTTIEDGSVKGDYVLRERMMALKARSLKRQSSNAIKMSKTAGLFSDGELGAANIADSNNIGYYSYEFPVDSLEMPQSRPEELRFYRLAYDRDPIVGRAIDLHTELPLSKMQLEKPKCSVESFADYVFDYYQRLVNDTQMFQLLIEATREYHTIGEAFLYVIQPDDFMKLEITPETLMALKKGRGYSAGLTPMSESENAPILGQESAITDDWIHSNKQSSKVFKRAHAEKLFDQFTEEGIGFEDDDKLSDLKRDIKATKGIILPLIQEQKVAARVSKKIARKLAAMKLAAPGDPPPGGDAPPPGGDAPDAQGDAPPGEGGDMPPGEMGEGAEGEGGMGDDPMGGGAMGGGGGGGMGGGMAADESQFDGAESALAEAADFERDEEINKLKRYLHLLERKKELLEELKEIVENKEAEKEIFSHVVNKDYEGFDRIQMLAPEKIELANDEAMGPEPQVMYKPTEQEKLALMENEELDEETRATLEEKGQMRLNTNPFKGPFVIHFARKKAGYELHGRSTLQRCMRTIIYREKLRQVQTTLASRNMTPKTVITAPGVSEIQVAELRAHADEAKADPDYTIVTNYELTWNEISSQGRLLTLGDEYQHLNSDIAIGLGFSPEILIGEGLYGGNRIQLELLNTTYTQFRESLTDVIENKIFKPLAQLKGFFELDNYGRPRWIYPKITFGRMALRDSGDLFEMLFNLYSKGSLPVATILEFLNIDAETVKRQLEDDLYTVNDSKFNELLSNVYATVGQAIVDRTDVVNRLTKGMMLTEKEEAGSEMEGSGEGL